MITKNGARKAIIERAISLILMVAMIFGIFAIIPNTAVKVSAADIPMDAIHINNKNILTINWAQSGKYYVLDEDINLTAEWIPIDNFSGSVFDGQGYNINNLYVLESSQRDYVGLFRWVYKNMTIKNIGINIGVQGVYATKSGGGLVGSVSDNGNTITIENCYVNGDVSNSYVDAVVGGLIGSCGSSGSGTVKISNCYATGNISAYSGNGSSQAGGLIGGCIGSGTITISNCYAASNISSGNTTGGLIGLCSSSGTITISACYAIGDVFGSSTGGLIGGCINNGGTQTISNCYSTGDVSSSSAFYAGGLIGFISNHTNSQNISGRITISNCYSTGDVSSSSPNIWAGGLIGDIYNLDSVTIIDCYRLSTQIIAGNKINDSGTPLTPEAMRLQSSFAGWDFNKVWAINPKINNGFPYLQNLFNIYIVYGDVNGDCKVDMDDLICLAKHIAEIQIIDPDLEILSDINGDGKINIADLIFLSRWLAGYNDKTLLGEPKI